jgi:hypothetical protein
MVLLRVLTRSAFMNSELKWLALPQPMAKIAFGKPDGHNNLALPPHDECKMTRQLLDCTMYRGLAALRG